MDYTPKLAKKDLIDGSYYSGRSRNANIARWDEKTQKFYYWRHKFGHKFVEGIKHPEDEAHFDVFVVEAECIPPKTDIPLPKDVS